MESPALLKLCETLRGIHFHNIKNCVEKIEERRLQRTLKIVHINRYSSFSSLWDFITLCQVIIHSFETSPDGAVKQRESFNKHKTLRFLFVSGHRVRLAIFHFSKFTHQTWTSVPSQPANWSTFIALHMMECVSVRVRASLFFQLINQTSFYIPRS